MLDAEVTLLDFDPDGEEKVLAAACFAHLTVSERDAARRVRQLGHDDRVALLRAYVGDRRNRRHRPGRAFERTDYRFELVTDYGAFRDLQRHRMLTVEWQRLGIALGYEMPDLVADAGLGEHYDEAIGRAEDLYRSLRDDHPEQASYAVALAHRIRYVMQFNAREAVHLIELAVGTPGPPGLPSRRPADAPGHRRGGRPPRPGRGDDVRRPRRDRPRAARARAPRRTPPGRESCSAVTKKVATH